MYFGYFVLIDINVVYLRLATSAAAPVLADLPVGAASSASDIFTQRAPSGSNTEKGNIYNVLLAPFFMV